MDKTELTTLYLADHVNGELIGDNISINGTFNILKDSKKDDVVIRHRIDEIGVEIAFKKGVSCIITQNPLGNAVKTAKLLGLPLIICNKIELANAFALKWSVEKFSDDAPCIVVTGTNGKSTTTHMIYTILREAGYTTYTNTDSKSEFNTLIDPMVAKQIAEFPYRIEAMVIEVSEIQGWMDRIMMNHAQLMTSALNPEILVFTNVSLDHIGLVNSIEESFNEILGALKGFNGDYVILNYDDPLIRSMADLTPSSAEVVFYGSGSGLEFLGDGIYYNGSLILSEEELPFKSPHFIQNTLAAVGVALTMKIDPDIIKNAVSSYKALNRRFSVLCESPLIIDDFAHNPDGIRVTIKSAAQLTGGDLYLVSAIRGSRGVPINQVNAEAIADSLKGINHHLIITSSMEMVDRANLVHPSEKKIFIETLEKNDLNYIFYEELFDALKYVVETSAKNDIILLIGAQGMDPAREVLKKIKD
jgi:UDP-N-acetylmuramoyl-L-alanyl-D-glutamate--2,6-diaminopimelate ligase